MEVKKNHNHKRRNHSISEGQVLSEPYEYSKARNIVQEMADSLVLQLVEKELVTDQLTLDICYDRENCDKEKYSRDVKSDHYGRLVPKPAHGSTRLESPTNLGSEIITAAVGIFDRIADKNIIVRRINIAAGHVTEDTGTYQIDLFTDMEKQEKEKKPQSAMATIKRRFGKNAVLKGTSYLEGATGRKRNKSIGGHRSGE